MGVLLGNIINNRNTLMIIKPTLEYNNLEYRLENTLIYKSDVLKELSFKIFSDFQLNVMSKKLVVPESRAHCPF